MSKMFSVLFLCIKNIDEQKKIEVVSHNRRSAQYKYMQSKIQIKIETTVSLTLEAIIRLIIT